MVMKNEQVNMTGIGTATPTKWMDRRPWCWIESTVLGSDRRSLFLTLTLPNLNLTTTFPSIPCLVSGRRSELIIIRIEICLVGVMLQFWGPAD